MNPPRAAVGLIVLLLAAVGALPAPAQDAADADLALTWDRAEVWVYPAGSIFSIGRLDEGHIQKALAGLDRKLPTVLYLHGCGFTKPAGWTFARWMAKSGYAIVMPDSFARPGRPETCDNWTRERLAGAPIEAVSRMRDEELAYAVARIREAGWVDRENLFLMGHDEGGEAIAASAGGGFKGYILSATLCARGLDLPPEAPLLILASADDPVHRGEDAGACARLAVARAGPTEALVLPGALHDLSGDPRARAAVLEFLARNTSD